MRLLVVEDDERMRSLLRSGLRADGYAVDSVDNGVDATWMASENDYDAVVLDIGLPDDDGFAVCERLRAAGSWTPILMLTARSAVVDRVRGLDAGGDDYLVKPFAFSELSARLRSLTRRGARPRPPVLRIGALVIDPSRRRATLRDRPLSLTAREFALLFLLAQHEGEVLTRTEIIEHVWDWAYDGSSNVVDACVYGLRERLGTGPGIPTIVTVRGVGYGLALRDVGSTGRPVS